MNNRRAKYLLTIAEEGSITKAAKKLYISQPSLSQMLSSAEKKFGVKLFERSPTALTPTYAGNIYLDTVREIMQIERQLVQRFEEIAGSVAGKLSFGVTTSKALYILPAVLPEFQRRYPNIEIDIVAGTNPMVEEAIHSRGVDIAVYNYRSQNEAWEYVELPDEEMLIVCPPNHQLTRKYKGIVPPGERPSILIKEIADEPFIYLSPDHGVSTMVDGIFLATGIRPPRALETNNNATAHALVAAGMGVTILPDNFVRYALNERLCMYASIADAVFRRKVALCYPKTPTISKSLAFLISLIHKKSHEMYFDTNFTF